MELVYMPQDSNQDGFPELKAAPIREVVCGVRFDRIPELDTLSQGLFFSEVREEYPKRQLRPPLNFGQVELFLSPGRTRTWFVSEDDCFVLQLQDDLLYLNWRKKDGDYPRFHDRTGQTGVLSRMLTHLEQLGVFCEREFDRRPQPRGLELAKVNWLIDGEHWSTWEDLYEMLPLLGGAAELTEEEQPDFNLRFARRLGENEGSILTVLQTRDVTVGGDEEPLRAVNLELRSRCRHDADVELERDFERTNAEVNAAFERVIPDARDRFA